MTAMKEAIIHPDLHVTIEDAPIPTPREGELIIKIIVAGANPIDWKGADEEVAKALHGLLKNPLHRNAGKDFAGYVHSVGPKVLGFKEGDRVVSVNHSSGYAEYGVGPVFSTAHIPDHISFEEAATTGLAYITAALALYKHMTLPSPFTPTKTPTPLIVYGASSATGLFTIKLAVLSNIHPIIAIAGKSSDIVAPHLDEKKGDVLLDYRVGNEALQRKVRSVASEIHHLVDCISSTKTVTLLSPLLAQQNSTYVLMLDGPHRSLIPPAIRSENPFAPGLWEPEDADSLDGPGGPNVAPRAFSMAFFGYLTFVFQEGLLKGHPYEVLSKGLGGIAEGMVGLRDGKNSGNKFLFRIAETLGLGGN